MFNTVSVVDVRLNFALVINHHIKKLLLICSSLVATPRQVWPIHVVVFDAIC